MSLIQPRTRSISRGNRAHPKGFSILELAVVVTILSILAGISIPSFLNFLKSSRIDQAKASLNTAIAECLQNYRTDPDNADKALVPDEKLAGLAEAGYNVVDGKNKCSDFMLKPRDPNENYLFQMGFMVRNGKVTKIAFPATDQGSKNACASWGTCGVPPELQDEWDRIAALEAAKKQCNEKFYNWLRKPSSGSNTRWDETSKSCSLKTWAFEGSIQANEDAYKKAEKDKYGEICTQKTADIKNKGTLTQGPYTIQECGERQFFFCLGEDKGSLDIMNACIQENQEAACLTQRGDALKANKNGVFGPLQGPGKCGEIVWLCNGKELGTLQAFEKFCPQNIDPRCLPNFDAGCCYSEFRGRCTEWKN